MRATGKIKIDGKLNEVSWQRAKPSGQFIQKYPQENTAPSESTTVKVVFDSKNLYVAVRAYESETDKIVARLSRRDVWAESDNITVYIDSYCDRRTAYSFETNPKGVQMDWYIYNNSWTDWDWNAVWDVGTHIDSLGWTAEFAIPFSILRFQNKKDLEFGFQVIRYISKTRESDEWQLIPKNEQGFVSHFGILKGITNIPTPKNLEFLPYGVGKIIDIEGEKDYFYNTGCNVKYGIGSNFILDATVNPDFGQVEADPSELNLTVFETYFLEKRPFFMEGKDLFKTEYELFYSRRIGKNPGYFSVLPGDIIKKQPDFTAILGAIKLTGKMKGSNFGLVEAVTVPEYAIVDSSGVEKERLIEPLTNYSVFRIKQDVLRSSNIGITTTACNRKKASSAYSGGIDWNIKLLNDYSTEGQIALSRTGEKGYADYLSFAKSGGAPLHLGLTFSEISKEFDIKDMGYIQRNNERHVGGWFSLFTSSPWWITHRISLSSNLWHSWNFSKLELSKGFNITGWITFKNYWGINFSEGHEFPSYNDWITRGGPALLKPSLDWINLGGYSDSRKTVSSGFSASFERSDIESKSEMFFLHFNTKTFSNLEISFSPQYSHSFDYAEWVINIDEDNDGIVDHYVFGELTTDILSASIRSDIAFSKNLTLQLWIQPYIAVGKYTNFKELIDADKFEFSPYTTSLSPDFNQKFLKINVVLRWEYSPGSSAYFVVTNALSDFSHPGDFSPVRDLRLMFKAKGEKVYLIKIDKWLSF